MKGIIFILKNIKAYRNWKERVKGKGIIDFNRGCGYYGRMVIGDIEHIKMRSGKIGICKLIKYNNYFDPRDMVENAYYQILGYKEDSKLFDEMTFKEFYNTYGYRYSNNN